MQLSSDEIHIWSTRNENIRDLRLLSQYYDLLNPEESIQQKRFHFKKDRQQYLVTRAMVRSVLSSYMDSIAPHQWQFEKNAYGKPFICNHPLEMPLHFNVSHTEKLVTMAVTLGQEIGIDVEYTPRMGDTSQIASHFFSPGEIKQLLDLPFEQQHSRFIDLWTLKEAYIKACGMGLSIPLNHFSYSFSSKGKISIEFTPEREDHSELWQFWQVQPSDSHKISIAKKSKKPNDSYTISMFEITPLFDIQKVAYPMAHGSVTT